MCILAHLWIMQPLAKSVGIVRTCRSKSLVANLAACCGWCRLNGTRVLRYGRWQQAHWIVHATSLRPDIITFNAAGQAGASRAFAFSQRSFAGRYSVCIEPAGDQETRFFHLSLPGTSRPSLCFLLPAIMDSFCHSSNDFNLPNNLFRKSSRYKNSFITKAKR